MTVNSVECQNCCDKKQTEIKMEDKVVKNASKKKKKIITQILKDEQSFSLTFD